MQWKDGRQVPRLDLQEGIPFLQFESLERTGIVRHLFTTRGGGVSKGVYASMNLGFTRGDERSCVEENFRKIAGILHCAVEDMVASDQTHTANVRLVTGEDRGHGITREKTFFDTDGMITDEPGIVLVTFYADCVPLFFVDPVNKAIGLSHSGWRGTVQGIGEVTVKKMRECFGSKPEDIIAAIGPSICADCYEVGEDVADHFLGEFWERYQSQRFCRLAAEPEERNNSLLYRKEQLSVGMSGYNKPGEARTDDPAAIINSETGKYRLNLWAANQCVLEKAGILPEHIEVTSLCTCCNSGELFSHRASQGKRGNMGAFLGLL